MKTALLRWLKRSGRIALLAYLGTCLVLFLVQGCMIFPGASSQGRPEARVSPMPGETLQPLKTTRGDTIFVLFGPALSAEGKPRSDAPHRPTLIFFYGNGMSMVDCRGFFDDFRRLGANMAVVEYPGYGMSSGKPSEKAFYAAADAAYEYVSHRPDVDAAQLIATGLSIGGGAAIDVASRHPVAGVVTFAAFTSLPAVARHLLPWFPTGLVIRYRFDNETKLRKVNAPVFLAHGTADPLVPFEMEGKLAAAAKGPVTVFRIEGGDHNDLFSVGGKPLMDAFAQFIERVHQRQASRLGPL